MLSDCLFVVFAIAQTQCAYIREKEKAGLYVDENAAALDTTMHIKSKQQAGVTGWLPPARYWASPEGQRRKELRRLDKLASLPHDMTPRLVKKTTGESKS